MSTQKETTMANLLAINTQLLAEMTAKRDALLADAALYRWLFGARTAEQASHPDVGLQPPLPQDLVLAELSGFYCHKEAVDQIITAAIVAEQTKNEGCTAAPGKAIEHVRDEEVAA